MVQSPDPSLPDETPPLASSWVYPMADPVTKEGPAARLTKPRLTASRRLMVAATVALLSSIAGLAWGSHLAAQELKLRLENTVSAGLTRPVEWGHLRGISFNGIRLGKTTLPPMPGDGSTVEIDAIDITFNWRALLQQHTPQATLTLVRPHLTLVQNAQGQWPAFPLAASGPSASAAGLKNLEALVIRDGEITLTTAQALSQAVVPRTPVTIADLQGDLTLRQGQPGQLVAFHLQGQLGEGGFKASGQVDLQRSLVRAQAQAHHLPITGINLLLPAEVGLGAGVVNSNLSLTAALGDGARLEMNSLTLDGTTIFSSGSMRLGQLPEPVSNLRGSLWFQGQQVTLNNAGLQMGDLALSTGGTVSLQEGYNLVAQIPAIQAADWQNLVGQPLPVDPHQTFQWQTRVTGPLQEPFVEDLAPPAPLPLGQLAMNPELLSMSLGMRMRDLPLRDRIPLIEGATYEFRGDGAWFVLTDGTVVPPLSADAYQQAARQFGSALNPTLDRKFFWLLQSSPYVTAIAADLGRGSLQEYLNGNTFNTDRFFLEYFLPIYKETSYAAGLDPGEALWMLDHSLRTLQDPLLRTPSATPIVSGAGTVGSFWRDEQVLSMQQLILQPQLAAADLLGNLTRFALLKRLELTTSLESRRLSSSPEVMSKIPNVTFGAEEGAIALALGVVQLQGADLYSENLRALAESIVQNEVEKQLLRSSLTEQLQQLAADPTGELGTALDDLSLQDWDSLGMGPTLGLAEATHLTGTNTLSVLVSRSEKAGYPLAQAYQNSRALLLELLQDRANLSTQHRLIYALLKDQAFNPSFWQLLTQQRPQLAPQFATLAAETLQYQQLARQGARLHEQFYAAMVQDGQDISVSATIKHAVGFQAHLARLLDQALAPTDLADPRYLAFRRSLAIYLREAPDIAVYGGTEAALRLYGYETLNVQELLAMDVASAPRIRALGRLYNAAWRGGMVDQWDVPGFQRILLLGSMLAAGVERDQLPAELAAVGFPNAQFRRDLLFAVGPEGIKLEATRLGVQAHDHRVRFQPIPVPGYRAPSFAVTDASACPTQPEIQAIALGPGSEFVWYPTIQRVVLKRGDRECPLDQGWKTLFFDTLLESAPVVHSPGGAAELQAKLREAQLLEAGIF